jgi:hypothetical protein
MAAFTSQTVALALCLTVAVSATAQEPRDLAQKPVLDQEDIWERGVAGEPDNPIRTRRMRPLGFPAGFGQETVPADDNDGGPSADQSVLVSVGSYNPYLGWRRPREPGVLGYSKFSSQVQILDLGETSVCVGLQALAPSGLEAGGRGQGPILVTPSLAWFHDLGDGVALHGFVGQDLQANSRLRENLDAGWCCGLAWQYPLAFGEDNPDQAVFFFVQGLASYRAEFERQTGPNMFWEVVPGIHWRVNTDCWLSIGASRRSLVTWSWQF